jgi:hypothetical protein
LLSYFPAETLIRVSEEDVKTWHQRKRDVIAEK